MGIICLYLLEVLYYAHTFFKRIIQPYYTFSNVYHPLLYTFSSESNVNLQKFSGFMTDFLSSNTFWKIKNTPQTTEIPRKPLPLYSTSVL